MWNCLNIIAILVVPGCACAMSIGKVLTRQRNMSDESVALTIAFLLNKACGEREVSWNPQRNSSNIVFHS
jgi:hypothetical protein